MEIGISMFGDLGYDGATGQYQQPQQRLQQMIEQIKLADEVGLDVFGLGEHHRAEYAVSAPEIILAAAAAVTKNIKLSSAVTVLSSSEPVRVFQYFATLDLISNGRAELALGRGSFTESFPLFGYDLRDYEQLFTEKLELFLQINKTKGPLTWKGRLTPSLDNQTILPRPTKPFRPWIAVGGTPESVVRAARLGLPMIIAIIGGQPRQFKPLFDLYKEEYKNAGHDAAAMQLAVNEHGLLGDDAQAVAGRYYPQYSGQMERVGRTRGRTAPYTRQLFESGRTREGALFIGGVSEVVDKLLYHREMFGLTRFMMQLDVGGPSHDDMLRTIELLGTQVKPAVDKAAT